MGLKNLMGAAGLAVALGTVWPTAGLALGAWECSLDDVEAAEKFEAEREATLSQKYFVTEDGRVEIVEIYIEKPGERPFLELLAVDLMKRLGIDTQSGLVARVLGNPDGTDKTAQAQVKTELQDWALSPIRRVRQEVPQGC